MSRSAKLVVAASLLALLLAGALVRIWGLRFGLGYEVHPDEWLFVRDTAAIGGGAFWSVEIWTYPPAQVNLASPILRALPASALHTAAQQMLAARITVVALSLVALAATAWTTMRIAGPAGGLSSLGVLAFSPLFVENSRYATADIPTAAGVALALLASHRLLERPTLGRYLVAGAAVGLAASFKYVGVVSAVAVVAAHAVSSDLRSLPGWAKLAAAGVASIATFLLLDLQVLTHASACAWSVTNSFRHYAGVHPGYATTHAARHALRYLAEYGLGPVAAVLALASLLAMAGRIELRRATIPALALSVAYLAFLGTRSVFFARNLTHVMPALALLSGVGLTALMEKVPMAWRRRDLVTAIAVVETMFAPAIQSVGFARELERWDDTRLDAAAWMNAELPRTSRLVAVPEIDVTYLPPSSVSGLAPEMAKGLPTAATLREHGYTHAIVSSGAIHRFTRTPGEAPDDTSRLIAWHAALERDARLLRCFSRPEGPGGDLFGATVDIYHNPTIEIFSLGP